MTSSDIGYDSSLSWTYTTIRLKVRTAEFTDEHALAGNHAIELLNAAKRLYVHSKPATVENAIKAVRLLARALAPQAAGALSAAECEHALVKQVAEAVRPASRHNAYKMGAAILREAARTQGLILRTRNPFRRDNNPIRTAPRDELKELIRCAREDALSHYRDRTDASSWQHPDVILAARSLAQRNGGLLPDHVGNSPLSSEYNAFLARVNREHKTNYNTRQLARFCYPTAETLLPYFILLIHKLAANVDAVAMMQRNCLREIDNPLLGRRFLVTLRKGRSPDMPPFSVADYGALSVPWLIRAVLSFTEPLVPLAPDDYSKFLFLGYSQKGSVLPLVTLRPSPAFRRYKRSKNLRSTLTLNMLRPTRLVDEYEKSLDPFRVQRIAQHKHLRETIRYLDHAEVAAVDSAMIADAQGSILRGSDRRLEEAAPASGTFSQSSHSCSDPTSHDHGKDEFGLCASLLWPLNDRHFVMRLEPRPVAFLLRDYEALLDAELRMPAERYRQLYLQKRRMIETRYLPAIDARLIEEAKSIAMTLPPAPRID
ncbi:MAG TPA: hypothetical protein VME66_11980 [Candidatus Acidoferrales bacterium]|nr:hypothetical protein [Candidatus Acidoferrales bacterium]